MDEAPKISKVEFWNWFQNNYRRYEFLDEMEEAERDKQLVAISKVFYKSTEYVNFRIGKHPLMPGKFFINFTCDGLMYYFKEAKEFIDTAPYIENWEFHYLRPPMGPDAKVQLQLAPGIVLDIDDFRFSFTYSSDVYEGLRIHLYVVGYDLTPQEHQTKLVSALVDVMQKVAGEESYVLDIAITGFSDMTKQPADLDLIPLIELPVILAEYRNTFPRPENHLDSILSDGEDEE